MCGLTFNVRKIREWHHTNLKNTLSEYKFFKRTLFVWVVLLLLTRSSLGLFSLPVGSRTPGTLR
jgi:hypothetical protein